MFRIVGDLLESNQNDMAVQSNKVCTKSKYGFKICRKKNRAIILLYAFVHTANGLELIQACYVTFCAYFI